MFVQHYKLTGVLPNIWTVSHYLPRRLTRTVIMNILKVLVSRQPNQSRSKMFCEVLSTDSPSRTTSYSLRHVTSSKRGAGSLRSRQLLPNQTGGNDIISIWGLENSGGEVNMKMGLDKTESRVEFLTYCLTTWRGTTFGWIRWFCLGSLTVPLRTRVADFRVVGMRPESVNLGARSMKSQRQRRGYPPMCLLSLPLDTPPLQCRNSTLARAPESTMPKNNSAARILTW